MVTLVHWKILTMLLYQFPVTFLQTHADSPFHSAAYDYSHADWDGLSFEEAPPVVGMVV